MTPLDLQDELVAEVRKILDGYLYKTSSGRRIPINVYSQNVPVDEGDEDEFDVIPYVIVRLNSGDDDGGNNSFNVVHVVFIVGVMDDDKDQQGYRAAMNIYQKIYQRFQENPNLNGKAVFDGDFHWANQEDGYFPYFFGACSLSFNIPAIRREDPLIYE